MGIFKVKVARPSLCVCTVTPPIIALVSYLLIRVIIMPEQSETVVVVAVHGWWIHHHNLLSFVGGTGGGRGHNHRGSSAQQACHYEHILRGGSHRLEGMVSVGLEQSRAEQSCYCNLSFSSNMCTCRSRSPFQLSPYSSYKKICGISMRLSSLLLPNYSSVD
jgi:hypothetical protein